MNTLIKINSTYLNMPRLIIIEAGFITEVLIREFSSEIKFQCKCNNGTYIVDTPAQRLIFLMPNIEYRSSMASRLPCKVLKFEPLKHLCQGFYTV